MYRLLITPRPPLDERWFARLQPLAAIPGEIYVYLTPPARTLVAARDRFYDTRLQVAPALPPDEKYRPVITRHLTDLKKLRADIEAHEPEPHIRTLYIDRIDELLTNCRLWLAAADQDMAAFGEYNRTLYRGPDPRIFHAACAWVREDAQKHLDHTSIGVREAAQEVLRLIPDHAAVSGYILPDEATFQTLYNLHFLPGGYVDQLFAGTFVPPDLPVSQREGDVITAQVLRNVGLPYMIGEDPKQVFWGIRHSTRQVIRPLGYHMEPTAFTGIIAHEIGSHLLERANGLRSGLQLLAAGLSQYEHGNEGRAYLREQLAAGSVAAALRHTGWHFSLSKHIAISLAIGLHDHAYTFAEVYQVLSTLYTLHERLQHPEQQIIADEQARQKAWAITVRVLQGTNGLGGAYLKDIVYLEGNVRCWQLARRDPYLILTGDTGKFNISNSGHMTSLRALGILR